MLAQQTVSLQALVDAADRGTLLSFKHALVVVDQGLVQDLLRAAMPIEGPVGAFQVRLESAEAYFADGLALVHLSGKATLIESSLAADPDAAWNMPTTTMRTKQQLVRALIEEIVVDVDDTTRELVLVIHWRGGRHSELRVRKPSTGEHTKRASDQAAAIIREMVTRARVGGGTVPESFENDSQEAL